jgi:hypothetical protein
MSIQPRSAAITTTVLQWEERKGEDTLQLTQASLDESTALLKTAIDEEALLLATNTANTEIQGSVLINQLESLVSAASTVAQVARFAKESGTSLGAAMISIGTGLASLAHGNLIIGIPATVIGFNEISKLVGRFRNITDATTLAGEARTGVQLIQQLEEYQRQSLETIEKQIELAKDQVRDAERQIEEIEKIATEGSAAGAAKKAEALKQGHEAAKAYRQALHSLEQSHRLVNESLGNFKTVIEQLDNLIDLAKKKEPNEKDFEAFIKQAESIKDQMSKIQEIINTAGRLSNSGLSELREASSSYNLALQNFCEAQHIMETALHEIQMKAKTDQLKELEKNLDKAQGEVKIAKERAETTKKVAEYTEEKLQELQEEQDQQWGTTTIMVTAGAATATAFVATPLLVVPVAGTAGAITHYTRRIMKYLSVEKPVEIKNPPPEKEIGKHTVQYSDTSTGWGGYTIGLISRGMGYGPRGSKTAGVIALNLGEKAPSIYGFNKNSNSRLGKMNDADIKKLDNDLRRLIKEGKLTHQECLNIMASLEKAENGNLVLITPDCVYLEDLKKECQRKIQPDSA